MELEFRSGEKFEIRTDDDGTVKVSGYAAVFNQEGRFGDIFREVIAPGAFDSALKRGDDVVFVVNHDGLPLARTRSGTLNLSADSHGLKIETELVMDDPDVKQIVPKMKRGDLDKMSFAFYPEIEEWDESDEDDIPLRTIKDLRLHDVSIVTTPFYEGTDIGLRSLAEHRSKKDEKRQNFTAMQQRLAKKRMHLALKERESGHRAKPVTQQPPKSKE